MSRTDLIRALVVVVAASSLSTGAHARSLFRGGTVPADDNPVSVAVSDFDGDGDPDLVYGNYSPGLTIVMGDGTGAFFPQMTLPITRSTGCVGAADFTSDGIEDLIATHWSTGEVSFHRGFGDGTFDTEVRLPAGDGTRPCVVTDLNDDGQPDVVVGNSNDRTLKTFLGNGDGTFSPQTPLQLGRAATKILAADLNGDGVADLVANESRALSIFLADGEGGLVPGASIAFNRVLGFAIGDFDGDDLADIAVNADFDEGTILRGLGDGTFVSEWELSAQSGNDLTTGDFNEDGSIDLALTHFFSDEISVRLGRGDGTFLSETRFHANDGPRTIVTEDVDEDGHQDLVVVNSGSEDISILIGKGDGTFITGKYPAGRNPQSAAVADFDEDGWPDLVVSDHLDNVVSVLSGNGDGSFRIQGATFETGPSPRGVVAADFDEDGHADIAVGHGWEAHVSVLMGRGDGSFDPQILQPVGDGPRNLEVGDFNEDGHVDLAVVNQFSDDVFILLGDGNGGLAAHLPLSLPGANCQDAAIADFDNDSHQDLAVPCSFGGSGVFLGRGDGGFHEAIPFNPGDFPTSIAAGDFNGDGFQDVVVAQVHRLSIVLGLGNGTFRPPERYPLPAVGVDVADFDRDGHLDVAAPLNSTNKVVVMLGNGRGDFPEQLFFTQGSQLSRIAVGDLNLDTLPDLVPVDRSSVVVLINQSNEAPTADAGDDISIECTSPSGANVLLNGSRSSDANSSRLTNDDIALFEWFSDFGFEHQRLLGYGEWLDVDLSLGRHRITLRVTDVLGETGTDEVEITVADSTPPQARVSVDPEVLWPPSHRMREITASVRSMDLCGGTAVALDSVTSSENDDVSDNDPDVQGAEIGSPDYRFAVRAERAGDGPGRSYDIGYIVTDESGNESRATASVWVPHKSSYNIGPPEEPLTRPRRVTENPPGAPPIVGHVAPFEEDSKLNANDQQDSDQFGHQVAYDGDTAVVASVFDDSQKGSVYVFERGEYGWIETAKLLPAPRTDRQYFGLSMALAGDTLVVGAPRDDGRGFHAGAVFVFRKGPEGWVQEARLVPDEVMRGDEFGTAVSFHEDTIIAGAPYHFGTAFHSGAVYVFRRVEGVWGLESELVPGDAGYEKQFGAKVAVHGETALVGAVKDHPGEVYVFGRTDSDWEERSKLRGDDVSAGRGFGVTLQLDARFAIIGADLELYTGAAYVFEEDGAGWIQTQKLEPEDGAPSGFFGRSSSLQGDLLLVGAYQQHRHGAAYLYRHDGERWTFDQLLLPSDGVSFDHFGRAVSLLDRVAIIGAPSQTNEHGDRSGRVYEFVIPNLPPTAYAGADRALECNTPGGAIVRLDGSGSVDPDSTPGTNDDIVRFEWFEDFGHATQRSLGEGELLESHLALGRHLLTLRVTDTAGETHHTTVVISSVDTQPPSLRVSFDPAELWPPDHRMVPVLATVEAKDECGEASVMLAQVVSDEPDAKSRSGRATAQDIQGVEPGTPDVEFLLRAERNGGGRGRTYTIDYLAVDEAGNESTERAYVRVSHD